MSITKGLASSAIQKAIYTLLSTDPTLIAIVGSRIYDAVPENTTDAYLVISGLSEDSDDTLEDGDAGVGSDVLFTIEGLTDDQKSGAGFKTVQAMADRVKILLHGANLSIAGWITVTCEHETTQFLPDTDEAGRIKRRFVSDYRVLAEAA